MFAMEHYAVEADLMTVAKSIAAGLPLSGVIGKAEIMDAPHTGAIGGTYIGNPIALAAALAVLDVFADEDLVGAGQRRSATRFASACSSGKSAGPRSATCAASARCSRSSSSDDPAGEGARHRSSRGAVIDAALERGLILLKAGLAGNCIRVLCPLTIEDAVLEEALATWEDALAAVLA